MDRDQAAQILDALHEEADQLRTTIRESGRQLDALLKLISGYIELYPELDAGADEDDDATDDVPRGQEAVERLLAARRGEWFTTRQIVMGLADRGWLPDSRDPVSAIRAALQRAWGDVESLVYKSGAGRGREVMWAYDPPTEDLDDEDEDFEPDEDDMERMRATEDEEGAVP